MTTAANARPKQPQLRKKNVKLATFPAKRVSSEKSFLSRRGVLCVEGALSTMLIRQIIVVFYLLLFLSVGAGSAAFFWQTRKEYNQLRQVELATQRRLAEAEQRLREQEHMLQRLRTDPAFVEMKIRQRLGYARPDEFIFRFDE